MSARKPIARPALALGALLALLAAPATLLGAQPLSFAPIVKSQQAKVVHINTTTHTAAADQPTTSEPFRLPDANRGSGSGFIISPDGYIVTNHHVVENTDSVEVVLGDERKFPAEIVGLDPQTDLALLKIAATDLPAVRFGDSSRVEVGDWVLAIGNPLGLDHTVTAGIISAKGRNIFSDENLAYGEFLQTDAAINPGNSGGPLFNLNGEVVGVNTAISRKGQGIGFAVPSNLVVRVVDELRRYGRVNRGWLGVVILELTREQVQRMTLPEGTRGVVVDEVLAGSPAQTSDLRKGDVLLAFGKERLQRVSQLQKLVALTTPGSEVDLQGLRREAVTEAWKPLRVHLRIGASPATADSAQPSPLTRLGLSALNIPDDVRQHSKLDAGAGVLVESVTPGGVAEGLGLRAGDIILEVNRTEVASRVALESALRDARTEHIPLVVKRENKILYLVLDRDDLQH
jgi:serine protease Do